MMKYKSICIVGVDGTGKSSTIEKLQNLLGEDNVTVQYMGARLWETNLAKRNVEVQVHSFPLRAIMYTYSYVYEMYHRVFKHNKSSNIVVFDRYAYEHVYLRENEDNGFINRITNAIFRFFLIDIFPKPNLTFYLFCPIEISISRKGDIESNDEKEALIRNKRCLDNCYLHKKGVRVIDTSIHTQDVVLNRIMEDMVKDGLLTE